MTVLERPETTPTPGPGPQRAPVLTVRRVGEILGAAVAGAVCVVLSLLVIAVPTLLAWVTDERSTATLGQSAAVSVDLWALAHRAQIITPAAEVVFAPLLLTALPLLLCWYAARQVILSRPGLAHRVPHIGGWRSAWHALGATDATVFVLSYLFASLALAHTASFGIAPVRLHSLVPGAVLIPLAAVVLVWWRDHRREEHPAVDAGMDWVRGRTPVLIRRAVPPAVEVLVALAAVCFLLVLGLLLLRGERILTLYGSLDAGLAGTAVLTLAQLAALPNLMVWALGWLSGAGLTVGTVHVGWSHSTAGDLPLIPVLGALPEPGSLPPGMGAMVLVPVMAGAWIGYRAVEVTSRLSSWWTKAQVALAACAVVGLATLVLGWLASGGLTPGRLGRIGVEPGLLAGLLTLEVAAGALVVVSLLHLVRARRLSRPAS
ncbi:DUF6350 family protein [Ornithinimicrobium pratense]|uniref:Uncharacterized protein n=1 Tax=Ornithinimicrobium pratense TaxID=2593973 RepID=A0A5J6V7L9_9MICO|nr:DUF6350 family protein [Ornithinimicrobium pratense]QFG69131.1 hypothetical protein FY030_10820 [Ornithinimicrobium pratense]